MLRVERAEKNWFVPPIMTFLSHKWSQKKFSNEFVWGQDGSLGAVALLPILGYVTAF